MELLSRSKSIGTVKELFKLELQMWPGNYLLFFIELDALLWKMKRVHLCNFWAISGMVIYTGNLYMLHLRTSFISEQVSC